MAAISKVFGVDKVVKGLAAAGKIHADPRDVVVGYTAAYALHVHENLKRAHGEAYNEKHAKQIKEKAKDPWGRTYKKRGKNQQAKFLEKPFREMQATGEIGRVITTAVKNGASLIKAMTVAGLLVQRASMKIVPIDTNHLRGSAFTRKE